MLPQVGELTEELKAVQTQKDSLLSAQAQCQEEAQQLRESLQMSEEENLRIRAELCAAAQREKELSQQCDDVTQQLDSLHSERSQPLACIEERDLKVGNRSHYMWIKIRV